MRSRTAIRYTLLLASAFGAGACGEAPAGLPEGRRAEAQLAQASLDGAINPGDSWAMADVITEASTTISTDTGSFIDPETLQPATTVSINAEPDTSVFQAGFSYAGEPVAVTVSPADPSVDALDVQTIRTVDTTSRDYSVSGQLVGDSPAEASSGTDPLRTMPALDGQALYDALVTTSPDTASCLICTSSEDSRPGNAQLPTPVVRRSAGEIEVEFSVAAKAGRGSVHIRRKYGKQGSKWLLEEVETIEENASAGQSSARHHKLRFRNVRFHEDSANNARRRGMRGGLQSHGASPSEHLTGPERLTPCDGECDSGGSEPPPPPPSEWGTCGVVRAGARGDALPGVVFQHGIWSDACTWRRMEPWILNEFAFGGEAKINTDSYAQYDFQRDQLAKAVNAMGDDKIIFIGHSNGGIVSRRMAQQLQSIDPARLQGVITIECPHMGAPAMGLGVKGAVYLTNALAGDFLYLCVTNQRGCGEVTMIVGSSGVINKLSEFSNTPLYSEMIPRSPFNFALNSSTESFKRVGIVGHSQRKYLWARMWADSHCDPDTDCGGREQVHRTRRFMKHLKHVGITATLIGIGSMAVNQPTEASVAFHVARDAGGEYAMIEFFDLVYQRVISWGDESDGIVPVSSQRYPHADQLYDIPNADSHVGATRSEWVRRRIESALLDRTLFTVNRR